MNLKNVAVYPLHLFSNFIDDVGELGAILKNSALLAKDWSLDVNRWRILRYAQETFPEEYALLDGGDRRIIKSFLDPDPISNAVSLLGVDARAFLAAPLSILRAPSGLLGTLAEPDSEFLLDLRSAEAALGTEADCDTTFVTEHEGARRGSERWYFINGIGTSRGLARRNADRLMQLLDRRFITINNPTQGLAEDVAESALQKFTNINTGPSAAAFLEIAEALMNPEITKVAVVAHSQGTIIAGDVLDLIYYSVGKDHLDEIDVLDKTNMNLEDFEDFLSRSHGTLKSDKLRRTVDHLSGREEEVMKKLHLYMFANAASRMCYLDPEQRLPVMESFANEHDIVARLGCLAEDAFHEEDLIRIDGPVFLRRGQYGHLLNAHYLSGDVKNAYELLTDGASPCIGRSLHDPVQGNPCARNPHAVTAPPNTTSRLLAGIVDRTPSPRPLTPKGDGKATRRQAARPATAEARSGGTRSDFAGP